MISWLLEQEVMWPSARGRRDAASEAARRARQELFGRMAAKASRSTTRAPEDLGATRKSTTRTPNGSSDVKG